METFKDKKEYIQALIRQNHPRHKEAMKIREKRLAKETKVATLSTESELIRINI